MRAMRGITVVGCGLDSGELLAATALRDALPNARLFVTAAVGESADSEAERRFRSGAAPVIAARHAGTAIDPAALVAEARDSAGDEVLIAAAPGGLLAPLTEHYSNRDFARELGLPLVIAARAGGGVTGQVRLVGEAARAAGLAVAAVVLTGWPDPPNRVQLDERELLSKIARAPVVTLGERPDADAAARWPVADWLEAQPPAAAAAQAEEQPALTSPAATAITLDPYDAGRPRQVGAPRSTRRPQIMEMMLAIIDAEGPMPASRAYSLY